MRPSIVLLPSLLALGLAGCSRDTPAATPTPTSTAVPTSSGSGASGTPSTGTGSAAAATGGGARSATAEAVDTSGAASSSGSVRPVEPTDQKPVPAAAGAFVAYYFATVDHAFRTGDVGPLRRASTAGNRTTADFITRATAMHRQGSAPAGPTQKVAVTGTREVPVPAAAVRTAEVTARYSSPAVAVVDSGHRTTSAPAVPERVVTVTVLWLAGHWRVDTVDDPAATTAGD